jgi:DNA-binding protein HU-beta
MTKAELVARIAKDTALTKRQSAEVLHAIISSVQEALRQGNQVTLVGFGTFGVRSRAARKGRHPRTGQEMWLPADRKPTFKAGKGLRHAVR